MERGTALLEADSHYYYRVQYSEISPCAALRPYVRCFWDLRGTSVESETILPDGCTELVFHYSGAVFREGEIQPRCIFVGQMTGPTKIRPSGATGCFGIRFEPAGVSALLKWRQTETTGKIIAAGDLFGKSIEHAVLSADRTSERIRLVEEALLAKLPSGPDIWVTGVSLVLNGSLTMAVFREQMDVGVRQFERLFLTRVGLTPRTFNRLARFRRALEHPGPWVDAAAECGYCDQSHLIRDFRQFAGAAPTGLPPDPLLPSQRENVANLQYTAFKSV